MTDDEYRLHGQLPPDEFLAELESLEDTQDMEPMRDWRQSHAQQLTRLSARVQRRENWIQGLAGACLVLFLMVLYLAVHYDPLLPPACAPALPESVMQLDPDAIRGSAREVYEL